MSAIAIDVATGFRTAWAANATLNGLLPSTRCYFIKGPATPTIPYAVFTIEPSGEPEYSTGTTTYVVNVVLRLQVFGTGLVSSLADIMNAAISLFTAAFAVSNTTVLATFLVDAGTITVEGERNAETVYKCEVPWRFMLKRNDG